MSIGRKSVIVVIILVLLAILTTLLFSAIIFRSSFLNLENQSLNRNVTRVANAISVEIDNLNVDTKDWASWDDTYYFAMDNNSSYIDRYFSDLVFETKKINFIVILDTNGKIVHAKAFDLNEEREIPIPQEFYNYLSSDLIAKQTDTSPGRSGIVLLSDNPLLISSQPILTSILNGPASGTLIFGKFVDATFLAQITKTTQSSIAIWQENNTLIPADFQKAKDSISAQRVIFTQPLNSKYAAGYTLINDVFGNPAVILKVTIARDIYNQGRLTIIFLFIVLALAAVLYCLIFISIMKKTILSRFTALTQGVNIIGNTGDVSKTISIPNPFFKGKDEISNLTDNINKMLGKIEETETKLRTQKYLFERLLLYSPTLILVVEGQLHIITLVNKTFCTLFNIREEEAIGKPLSAFLPAEEIVAAGRQISAVEGSVTNFEYRPKLGKSEMIIDTTIITINHEEFLFIGRDVTQEREEQEKLYLNDRLASVGEMAAGIAHELNNPLTGIVMLSQLLLQTDFPDNVRKDLSDINSEATRATDVVRNLLAFARKQPPAKRPTQINKIVNDVLRLRHYEETVNNINVVTNLDPNLPEIMVDNLQIQQVFLNLILNAEYSMTHIHKQGKLQIDSYISVGNVVVSFTDDGEGIKEEDMKKLFQPFFTTKEVGVGTGLGLSLCFGIVKRHGGMIYVKSKYGSGATFTIELPIDASIASEDESGSK